MSSQLGDIWTKNCYCLFCVDSTIGGSHWEGAVETDVICDVPCAVLEGRNWQAILGTYSQSIVFIDEGNAFVGTEAFASAVKASDNYFVLITRENLYNLPYSVEEIYGLHSSGKYQNTRQVYQEFYRIYTKPGNNFRKSDKLLVDKTAGTPFQYGKKAESCLSA